MKHWILLLSIFLVVDVYRAEGYPIPPVTLSQLCEDADLIVLAKVLRTEPNPDPDEDDRQLKLEVAVLRPIEVWLGESQAGTIKVAFPFGLTCPTPPQYYSGETVLAFLERAGNLGDHLRYRTLGLSYGTKYLEPAQRDLYRERVREWKEIQLLEPESQRMHGMAEWLLEGVAHSETQFDAVLDLVRSGQSFEFDEGQAHPDYAAHLSDEQKEWLREWWDNEGSGNPLRMWHMESGKNFASG